MQTGRRAVFVEAFRFRERYEGIERDDPRWYEAVNDMSRLLHAHRNDALLQDLLTACYADMEREAPHQCAT